MCKITHISKKNKLRNTYINTKIKNIFKYYFLNFKRSYEKNIF